MTLSCSYINNSCPLIIFNSTSSQKAQSVSFEELTLCFFPYSLPSPSSFPHLDSQPISQVSINDHIDYTNTFNDPFTVDPYFSSSFASPILTKNMTNQQLCSSEPSQDVFSTIKNLTSARYLPESLQFSSSISRNKNTVLGDLANHDWEAVKSFLSCQVRPGGDISTIYKCKFCNHEFPNAQAFGGHMSSHSKTKRKVPSKRMKRVRKETSSYSSRHDIRLEKELLKENMRNEKFAIRGFEMEGDEEWIKYGFCL